MTAVEASGAEGAPRRRGLIVATVAIIAVALLATGTFLLVGGESEAEAFVAVESPPPQPVFEPKFAAGDDPFFPLETQVAVAEQELGVEILDEDVKTGLYGGTAENTCDPERMISFLIANPDIGHAWADVQGIDFADLPAYIRALEVQVLAADFEVLNHGYDPENDAAYEIDSILAEGTAVLVDENGDIRARCYCGNPIKPKLPTSTKPRCVSFAAPVFATPTDRSSLLSGVPSRVFLTGMETTYQQGRWVEISWANETGWVQDTYLERHRCAPVSLTWCAGPGVVDIFDTPQPSNQLKVGELNSTVNTVVGPRNPMARVTPAGGSGFVELNGFVMIHFDHVSPFTSRTGWVSQRDLLQSPDDCDPLLVCIDAPNGIAIRGGSATKVRPPGQYWAEYLGVAAPANASYKQVRIADGSGDVGWIDATATARIWDECDDVVDPPPPPPPPPQFCVRNAPEAPGWAVFNSPTTTDRNDRVAMVHRHVISVLSGPVSGRYEVRVTPTGPVGWIDSAALSGEDCKTHRRCIRTTNPAVETLGDSSTAIAGTPGGPYWATLYGLRGYDGSSWHRHLEIASSPAGWVETPVNVLPDSACEPAEWTVSCTVVADGPTYAAYNSALTPPGTPVDYLWDFDGYATSTASSGGMTAHLPGWAADNFPPLTVTLTVTHQITGQVVTQTCGTLTWEGDFFNCSMTPAPGSVIGDTGPVGSTFGPWQLLVWGSHPYVEMQWDYGEVPPGPPTPATQTSWTTTLTSGTWTYSTPGVYQVRVRLLDINGNPESGNADDPEWVDCGTVTITGDDQPPPPIEYACRGEAPGQLTLGQSVGGWSVQINPPIANPSFVWHLDNVTTNTSTVLANTTASQPAVTPSAVGDYVVRVEIFDAQDVNIKDLECASFEVIGDDDPPEREFECVETAAGYEVIATPSFPGGLYAWVLVELPGNSNVIPGNTATQGPVAIGAAGTYEVRVAVMDSQLNTLAALVCATIVIEDDNPPPPPVREYACLANGASSGSLPLGFAAGGWSVQISPSLPGASFVWHLDHLTTNGSSQLGSTASQSAVAPSAAGDWVVRVEVFDGQGVNVRDLECARFSVYVEEVAQFSCSTSPSPADPGAQITATVTSNSSASFTSVGFVWLSGSTTLESNLLSGVTFPVSDPYNYLFTTTAPDRVQVVIDTGSPPPVTIECPVTVCPDGTANVNGSCIETGPPSPPPGGTGECPDGAVELNGGCFQFVGPPVDTAPPSCPEPGTVLIGDGCYIEVNRV